MSEEAEETSKYLLPGIIIGLPLVCVVFFFVIWPSQTVKKIVSSQNITEVQLLGTPREKSITEYGTATSVYRVSAWGLSFIVPDNYIPVSISPDQVYFRESVRINSRVFYIRNLKSLSSHIKPVSFLEKLFIPASPYEFFENILYATWNPIRLLCKARLLDSQDIRGTIYKTLFSDGIRGYIFPTSGGIGYVARIFNNHEQSTFYEFGIDDPIYHVKLEDWMKYASGITFSKDKKNLLKSWKNISLEKIAEKLAAGKFELSVSDLLEIYFQTFDSKWIYPMAYILEKKGFYRETLSFFRSQNFDSDNEQSSYKIWQALIKKCFSRFMPVKIERKATENKLTVIFENRGNFILRNIKTVLLFELIEGIQEVKIDFFKQTSLQPGAVRSIDVELPRGLSLISVKSIDYIISDAEFIE
ncbi:MAG: hypothetical protein HQM10_01610 [Candidatus Riflebacteria bacterium]|nr:hypothetical protein [Candidatus Riflebacteria bacterium]